MSKTNGVFNRGLYLGPSLQYLNASLTSTYSGGSLSGGGSGFIASLLVGYGWFWNSFNMMLGLGANVGIGNSKISITDSSGTTTNVATSLSSLDAEFSLGWTF